MLIYLALECAGFLKELGNEVIMINRSTFLRVFDQTIGGKIMSNIVDDKLKAFGNASITNITKESDDEYLVELLINGESKKARVNSIMLAIGRDPNTNIASESGVSINPKSMKIEGRKDEPERT
jgi:pyruvate/2-oxoglutarate dehydrogenase complex dihydrolipoamide dehydrogenase (E3) component